MTSNDHLSPRRTAHNAGAKAAPLAEETLKTERLQIERKWFVFSLKENPRGRFLRITEEVAGRRDTIIVPAPGLPAFKRVFDEMASTSGEIPGDGNQH